VSTREIVVSEGDLVIRRMQRDDFTRLLAWRRAPHVREFWDNDDDHGEATMGFIEDNYGELLDRSHVTTATIIEVAGAPIGYLQFYRWSAYADGAREMGIPLDDGAFGLDVFIGEASRTGRGEGSRAVDLVCRHLFEKHGASRVALLTSIDNVRAQKAYERAGFARVRRTLDKDTRGGERIAAWLMVRERAIR
jgi:RimJ/RimL family protein N-acetyltransferase